MSFLESWYEDNISGKDGKFKGRGFGAAILKPFVDEEKIEQQVQRTRNQETAQLGGYTLADLEGLAPGASTVDVQGAVIRQKKTDTEQTKEKDIQTAINLEKLRQAPGLEQMRTTNERLLQQGKDTHQLALLQLASEKESRASQLEYQRSRDRRADQEYNERMERLDRKDRQAMMQNLAAGLASLGAAFAL